MISWLARFVVRISAILAPGDHRARWREEWLAEIAAAPESTRTLARALSAPFDAWSTRGPAFAIFAGWRTDTVHAFRLLIRRPGHTLAVVLCLAVGLTVSISTFSVLTSMLFGDQPGINQRDRMFRAFLKYRGETIGSFSVDDFEILRQPVPGAGSLAAEGDFSFALVGRHGPVGLMGSFVSGAYFGVLATTPQAGRLLVPEDERSDAEPVAVVSDYFWRTHLDGQSDAIGRPILVAGRSFTVVGVAPPRFRGLDPGELLADDTYGPNVWIPLQHAAGWPRIPDRKSQWLVVVGRLRGDATRESVRSQLTPANAPLAALSPSTRINAALVLTPWGFSPDSVPLNVAFMILGVLAVPLAVLAIGCANVANLQLARAAERSRELAVRLSFGASRGQLIRLLTIETMTLSVAAVCASALAVSVIMRFVEPHFPLELEIDWRVTMFSGALMLGVTFATGLVPAWLALRKSSASQLKQSAQAGGLGHARLRHGLVVAQVSLSLVMLFASSIFLRAVERMQVEVPPVLREQVVADFDPSQVGSSPAEARAFADRMRARVEADPRVKAVSLSRKRWVNYGRPDGDRQSDKYATYLEMTPSWLQVMQVPLLTGRSLEPNDRDDVVLVSLHLAEVLAPNGSPLGQMLQVGDGSPTGRRVQIVGVVADNRTQPMGANDRPGPVIYGALPAELSSKFTIHVRGTDVAALMADLRAIARDLDPRLPWLSLRRGDESYLDDSVEFRAMALAIGGAGLLALALAATGLYAVMGYVVTLRRREIGVRMAIGADPRRIVTMVMRQALAMVALGAAIGLALGVPFAFVLRSGIGSVEPLDPLAFLPTLGIMLACALAAAAVPARRAARIDPIKTLRQD